MLNVTVALVFEFTLTDPTCNGGGPELDKLLSTAAFGAFTVEPGCDVRTKLTVVLPSMKLVLWPVNVTVTFC
jgi:hypothetical protein